MISKSLRQLVAVNAALGMLLSVAGCGRDGYVVAKETKTPRRAFNEPSWPARSDLTPDYTDPLPLPAPARRRIAPVALEPDGAPTPTVKKIGVGYANLSAEFVDRTQDRETDFDKDMLQDCAVFEAPGKRPALYVHFEQKTAARNRKFRAIFDLAPKDLKLNQGVLGKFIPASINELMSVGAGKLEAKSFVSLTDDFADVIQPPFSQMDVRLDAKAVGDSCHLAAVRGSNEHSRIDGKLVCKNVVGADRSLDPVHMNDLTISFGCPARRSKMSIGN